jgi:quercetin dioxygenase-like cupin family protein
MNKDNSSEKINFDITPPNMSNKEYVDLVNQGKFIDSLSAMVPLDPPFTDDRGVIQNLWLGNCGSVTLITTKAGSVRANHTHHGGDWHAAYVISGEIKYSHGDPNPMGGIIIECTFKAGDMFFSPPEVWHKMEFPVDTVFITMNGICKNHENYEKTIERLNDGKL